MIYSTMYMSIMPPKRCPGLPRPLAEEIEVERVWIDDGTIPKVKVRAFSLDFELRRIQRHIHATCNNRDCANWGDYSVRSVHNDPTVDDLLRVPALKGNREHCFNTLQLATTSDSIHRLRIEIAR